MTLIELLVSMLILSVLGTVVAVAFAQTTRNFLHTDEENQGLADAKTVLDRVARDVRDSRGVVCDGGLADPSDPTSADPNCAAHLQLWIDSDSDFAQDAVEVVTWRLQKAADGEHFDVWRISGDGSQQLVATSLIVQTLFEYDTPDPDNATVVTITMEYDARAGVGLDPRTASTTAKVRNK